MSRHRTVSAKTIAKRIAYVLVPCSATIAFKCLSRWRTKLTWAKSQDVGDSQEKSSAGLVRQEVPQ